MGPNSIHTCKTNIYQLTFPIPCPCPPMSSVFPMPLLAGALWAVPIAAHMECLLSQARPLCKCSWLWTRLPNLPFPCIYYWLCGRPGTAAGTAAVEGYRGRLPLHIFTILGHRASTGCVGTDNQRRTLFLTLTMNVSKMPHS